MQAQNSAKGKKSKKGRQYPAPPARSKAGRLVITKEFINFLLDHDLLKLTSLDSRRLVARWRQDALAQKAIPKTYDAPSTSPHSSLFSPGFRRMPQAFDFKIAGFDLSFR
jgi:hypothetical protein